MKYITEEELRDLRDIQAFETFTLMEGVKLTPGGRQFLVDCKIPIIVQGEEEARETVSIPANNCSAEFDLLGAIFFRQAMEFLEENENLANEIYHMKCCLESIACNSNENIAPSKPWEGQLTCCQNEPVEMSRDVMFAEHGKEVAVLNLLRCQLQHFCFHNGTLLTTDQKNRLSHLMNCLLQMIRNFRNGGEN